MSWLGIERVVLVQPTPTATTTAARSTPSPNSASVVFASSNHAVGFYPRVQRIGVHVVARPDTRYGVSKVFGEALGALYADKYGLRMLCFRIGNVGQRPVDLRRQAIWLKPEDLVQLIRIGLEHPDLRFEVMYGASLNERTWWDNSVAYNYGYRPSGRAEDHRDDALAQQAKLPPDPVGDFYQGRPVLQRRVRGRSGPDLELACRLALGVTAQGQQSRGRTCATSSLLRRGHELDVEPLRLRGAGQRCSASGPGALQLSRHRNTPTFVYFFIAAFTGSLTFSTLSNSTLSSLSPTLSTRRM
jgi:hypothetical protein